MRRLALIKRCFRLPAFVLLAVLLPLTTWAQEEPTSPPEPRVGVLRITGMVGFVSSIGPSQIELALLEHATLTVHIKSSTEITEDGQPSNLSAIRVASAVRVRGEFDLPAHNVEAAAIDLLPPKESRLLDGRSGNFLKTWTAGTVTNVHSDSVALQRLDGVEQTIQLDAGTSYVHRGQPVNPDLLRKGERIMVQFWPNHPAVALSISIQGIVPQTLNSQEPPKPQVEAEQVPRPSQPSCRCCPNPDFPDEAKKAGILSARAVLEITVSEKGDVDPDGIRVIDDPGDGFAKEAVEIVKKWKFKPAADKDGKPLKTRTSVEITWRRWER